MYLVLLFGFIIRNFNVYKTANGYNADNRTIRMMRLKKAFYRRIWINLLLKDICKIVNIHHHQLTISSRHGINFYITAMCEQNVFSLSTVIMQQKGLFRVQARQNTWLLTHIKLRSKIG